MLDEHVPFFEGAGVEQKLDALARGQLASRVLRADSPFTAAEAGFGPAAFKFGKDMFHGRET
jgi:hypothetical protein